MVELHEIRYQDAAIAQLSRHLVSSRRPHACILTGPAGVGRTTTAAAVAKILLCESARLGDGLPAACGVCGSCRAFDSSNHGDYHLIYKELARYSEDPKVRDRKMQELGIPVIREFLITPANRRSVQGRGKVFVVREAELMSDAAQNALLKTLEEPPPGVTLMLVCTSVERLLPTTRSRCALVRFGYLDRSFVAEKLLTYDIDPREADFLAGLTGGSIGQAKRLAERGLYPVKRELVDRLAGLRDDFDTGLGEWLVARAESFANAIVAEDRQLAKTLATRQATGAMLGLLASIYRDAMRLVTGRAESPVHADQLQAIERIAGALDVESAADIVAQLDRYEQLLWRNVNPKIVWGNVVVTCATGAPLSV